MGIIGKLSAQIQIKSGGDVFHQLYKHKPHEVSKICSNLVQGCDLHQGSWGEIGAVICWNYMIDGEQRVAKEIIEAIDEEKRSITFKVIEGDLMEFYKSFKVILHVETSGNTDLVTWTLEYEKMNEDIEEPFPSLQLLVNTVKDIDSYHYSYIVRQLEMGLTGKLSAQIEYKSGGDVFHEVFRYMPHEISNMSPEIIQGCGLHQGELGTAGSVLLWNYTHDGKKKVAKEIVDSIDEEKRSVRFKMIEGDLLELYKTFYATFHVETHGDIDLVTWTLEYEKLKEDVEDPLTLLGLCIKLTGDIESHHLKP
ncbi:MLP-like protein 28 [Primulina eburnea]|uniref:MLP-like protein 28 n=1 Tax=Primulina eburnea TaxID=1245227 RepID=UPI003C6C0A98